MNRANGYHGHHCTQCGTWYQCHAVYERNYDADGSGAFCPIWDVRRERTCAACEDADEPAEGPDGVR